MSATLDDVRVLHAHHEMTGTCQGCDRSPSGWEEGGPPSWPCRTARLVYSAGEITEVLEARALFEKWRDEMTDRNPPHFSWMAYEDARRRWLEEPWPVFSVARGGIHYDVPRNPGRILVATRSPTRRNGRERTRSYRGRTETGWEGH